MIYVYGAGSSNSKIYKIKEPNMVLVDLVFKLLGNKLNKQRGFIVCFIFSEFLVRFSGNIINY